MSHNVNDINDDEIRIIRPGNNRRPLRDRQPPRRTPDDEEEDENLFFDRGPNKDRRIHTCAEGAFDGQAGECAPPDEDKSFQTSENIEECYYRDIPSKPKPLKAMSQQSFDEDDASSKRRWRSCLWPIAIILVCLGLIRLCTVYYAPSPRQEAHADEVASVSETGDASAKSSATPDAPASKDGYVSVVEKKVGDWSFKILYPHNAVPTLAVGKNTPDEAASAVLITHAADVRADNEQILGAFVLKGNLISRGKSKGGYCAIINGQMTIGIADATPLLETATETEGYFFRQFPLVVDGQVVENAPYPKAAHKALAQIDNEMAVVISEDNLSFDEFSEALIKLGVDNAIRIVGGESYVAYRTADGETVTQGRKESPYENANYIVWR